MDYKVIISNKCFYQEIKIPTKYDEYTISTEVGANYRLNKNVFTDCINLVFVKKGDRWGVKCSDNLRICFDNIETDVKQVLNHGEHLVIEKKESHEELFYMDFVIDFEYKKHDFARKIELMKDSISIGTKDNNDIVLGSEYAVNDSIILNVVGDKLQVNILATTYGVQKNGRQLSTGEYIENTDFLSIADIVFYYKEHALWTDISNGCHINDLIYKDLAPKRKYPLFERSTRINYMIPDEAIQLLVPPNKPQEPQQNLLLSLLPALAMLILTIVVRGFMSNTSNSSFVIFSVCSMSIGIITSIFTAIYAKKNYKKECKERIEKYNSYILHKQEEIEIAREDEKKILDNIFTDTEKDLENVKRFSIDLFDRTPRDDDFMTLFIGRGLANAVRKIDYKKQDTFNTNDELADVPEIITNKYSQMKDAPITIDMKKNAAVGVIGSKRQNDEFFKVLFVDAVARHYFGEVKIYLLLNEEKDCPWAKRVPHIYSDNGLRNIVFDAESRNTILESLYNELTRRKSAKNLDDFPYLLVFIKNDWGIKNHPVAQFIEYANKLKVSFVFFASQKEEIPLYCGTMVVLEDDAKGMLIDTKDGKIRRGFVHSTVSDTDMVNLAKMLEPIYCDEISLESSLRKSISIFELLNIYSVDDINLLDNWNKAKVWNSMDVPIGVNSKNETVSLNLHEKFHGPHGLVAGTTGSGKSEILQTYILSAALLYHPYEVSFVIIDFKGGGMVNQFKDLPHLIGSITNIDGREIDRSLKSIKAELVKRQELFAQANVNHIDKYIQLYKSQRVQTPLPHLIIIVDEFAELKAEQPEFMKELISAARIGRSLGVHLILATQKPSGQVNEQIWSNSRFKLCLKVQNKEDSNEVLRSPLAAEIKEPGRAYLQVGNNEIFELFQSGFSGAYENDANGVEKSFTISKVDFGGRRKVVYKNQVKNNSKDERTQLEAIVDYISKSCENSHIQKLASICLPSLPEQIRIKEFADSNGAISIGQYDNPDAQYQGDALINITGENYVVIGSSATGKTNLLQVIIRQIVNAYSVKQANIYIMDFGAMYLKIFEGLCYVGGVVTLAEEERLKNLFKLLVGEIQARKEKFVAMGISSYASYEESGYGDIPRIFVLLDNYTAFREIYGDKYEEEFVLILREGLACGINIILTNTQTTGLGYKYMANFAGKIAFHCNDSSEYSTLFERCRMQPKEVVGRALCRINKEVYETQTFLAFEGEKEIDRSNSIREYIVGINERYPGECARKIPEIPEKLSLAYMEKNYRIARTKYSYPIGLDYATVDLVNLDFESVNELCIVGNDSTKKINALKKLLHAIEYYTLQNNVNMFIIDDINRELKVYQDKQYVSMYTLDYPRIEEWITQLDILLEERYQRLFHGESVQDTQVPLQIFVINCKEAIEVISSKTVMEKYSKLLKKYKKMGFCFIYADIDDAAIPYAAPELMKRLKENRRAFLTTSKLKDVKFCDIQASTIRNMKNLDFGDVYYLRGTEVDRIKLVEE